MTQRRTWGDGVKVEESGLWVPVMRSSAWTSMFLQRQVRLVSMQTFATRAEAAAFAEQQIR